MKTTVHNLIICHTCHHRIKDEVYTEWENSIYCDSCFELYKEMVSPIAIEEVSEDNHAETKT
ncbi:hypothetical protein MKX53_18930 [Psychrobacillus sp. FSL K6-4615]|uniref:hypothetical protein n=1 Tax=Psychrobacillus sp. FSL K6-4615 TaxID=2921551 RepID=UPI0030FD054E